MDNDDYERSVIEFESARNEAMDSFFQARPYLPRTDKEEKLFEGGFRMAWEHLKARTNPGEITLTEAEKRLNDFWANRWRFEITTRDALVYSAGWNDRHYTHPTSVQQDKNCEGCNGGCFECPERTEGRHKSEQEGSGQPFAWFIETDDGPTFTRDKSAPVLAERFNWSITALYTSVQQEAEPVYRCHNCGEITPPPEPFKMYVKCGDCGELTAATAALVGHKHAQPAKVQVPDAKRLAGRVYQLLCDLPDNDNVELPEGLEHCLVVELDELERTMETALEEISASPSPAKGEWEGWKLVPVKPTQAMLDALYSEKYVGTELADEEAYFADMLAAAPNPPQEG